MRFFLLLSFLFSSTVCASFDQCRLRAILDFENAIEDYRIINNIPNGTLIRLSYNDVKKTHAFKENMDWAKKLKDQGYTVLDMGDPFGSNADEGLSAFYDVEKMILFGE